MDYMRIGKLTEGDFDRMIEQAGGSRVVVDDAQESAPNADYRLDDALIELKLVEEEGFEKTERQRKLAGLFDGRHPGRTTIVLDANTLDDAGRRKYYNTMAGPLKGHVKKAAKQLAATTERLGGRYARVLLLVNNGYSALDQHEFAEIALKCVHNDTTKVDAVITGGTYYYSDKFDMFTFFPFDLHPVNVSRPFRTFDGLRAAWTSFAENFMTDLIRGDDDRAREKLPVVDLSFELDGTRYIKPTPKMGHGSSFWREHRPRENSTGIDRCPPVGVTFPKLTRDEWGCFKDAMPSDSFFKESYEDFTRFAAEEARQHEDGDFDPRQPFVPVEVTLGDFMAWCQSNEQPKSGAALCRYTADVFTKRAQSLVLGARELSRRSIVTPVYVLVRVDEIGQDAANDISAVVLVRERAGCESEVTEIVTNLKAFHEYALAVGAAYAIKHGVTALMYVRDRTYVWE